MAPLEIIIRAKLVRYKYEYLVYYVCNKQPNVLKAHFTLPRNQSFLCLKHQIFGNNINKYHLYLSISVWKDYFNTKK